MAPFMNGFADELIKTARAGAIADFAVRLGKSKSLRDAIRKSTLLGAGTGALSGALSPDGDKGLLRRMAGSAVLGAAGGALTGSVMPGWFGPGSHRAHGEF